jgi:hypothetical protein
MGTAVWVSVLVMYLAPADAVDWRGPWTRGRIVASENLQIRSRLQKRNGSNDSPHASGYEGPMLYRCVQFPESLP